MPRPPRPARSPLQPYPLRCVPRHHPPHSRAAAPKPDTLAVQRSLSVLDMAWICHVVLPCQAGPALKGLLSGTLPACFHTGASHIPAAYLHSSTYERLAATDALQAVMLCPSDASSLDTALLVAMHHMRHMVCCLAPHQYVTMAPAYAAPTVDGPCLPGLPAAHPC